MKYLVLLFLLGSAVTGAQIVTDSAKQAAKGLKSPASPESARFNNPKASLNEFLLLLAPVIKTDMIQSSTNMLTDPFSPSLNEQRKQMLMFNNFQADKSQYVEEVIRLNRDELLQALSYAAHAQADSPELAAVRQFFGYSKTIAAIMIIIMHLVKFR